ncbi:helix-turn-helix transcriptional regulator [Mycobacteroides abscessus]|nr:helix-turn-helix transcriptional regulator [Mycobacteroides abscessus]
MEKPEAPPEAVLIKKLRLGIKPRLSIRSAAKLAEVSEGRWRQIEKGYQQLGQDTQVEAQARPETLARMAKIVGATPESLTAAGRDDAAEILRALIINPEGIAAHPEAAFSLPDTADDNDEIYELEAVRSIQHTIDAILGTPIPFSGNEIIELSGIRSTAIRLPEIFGRLLHVPMGRRELMRNCISLQHRINAILRNHSTSTASGHDG